MDAKQRDLVSILLPSFHGGGAERAMLTFAHELVHLKSHRVDIVVVKRIGELQAILPQGVRIIDLQGTGLLRAVPRLIRYMRAEQPRALFSTITHANVAASLCGTLAGSPCAVVVRQSNGPLSAPRDSLRARATHGLLPHAYRRARAVIAVSEGVAQELTEIDRSLQSKIFVEPNPVITSDFLEKAAKPVDHPWFTDGGPPLVLGMGRLEPCKGFLDLIRAWAEVQKNAPSRLLILGEGSERSRLEREVEALGLQGRVALPGFRRNPLPFMKQARVFVLSSYREGMPNVLIQALGLGTRVVATDCPHGPREIMSEAGVGDLVRPGDTTQMAGAIARALQRDNGGDREAYSAAQRWVAERFGARGATLRYLRAAGL